MNVIILSEDNAHASDIGERISDIGAELHQVSHFDALQHVLSKLCKRYDGGCCLVIHESFDHLVAGVTRRSGTSSASPKAPSDENRPALPRHFQRLSPRESEVLRHVLDGLTSQEIADRLKISLRTVKMHRGNIMAKVRVRNVAELVSLYHTTAVKAA